MAKLESTFRNMVCSLVGISMVAAAALAGVYSLTNGEIEKKKVEKENQAIYSVLPNNGAGAVLAAPDTIDAKLDLIVTRAYTDSTFTNYIGAAVKTSENGFGGKFKIMVGFDPQGKIVNYTVLEHQETPGLGDKMGAWFKDEARPKSNVIGRQVGDLQVSKEGGDVDAITAATISSKAFLKALNGLKDVAAPVAVAAPVEDVVPAPADAVQTPINEKEANHE